MTDSPNKPEPPPESTDGAAVWDLVLADIEERDATGARKYGQRLSVFDGRSSLVDAYQEAMDLVVYLRKEIAERLPSGAGRVLQAARDWAAQGSRSKWTTETSKRLWDAVAALGESNEAESRDVVLRRQAEKKAEEMRARAIEAERDLFALKRLSRIHEPNRTVVLGHFAGVAVLGMRAWPTPKETFGISLGARLQEIRALLAVDYPELRVAALVIAGKEDEG